MITGNLLLKDYSEYLECSDESIETDNINNIKVFLEALHGLRDDKEA